MRQKSVKAYWAWVVGHTVDGWEQAGPSDVTFALSNRSMLAQQVGLGNVENSLDLLELLVAGYKEERDAGRRANVDVSTGSSFATVLRSFERKDLGMERSVMGEYLLLIHILEVVEKSPERIGVGKLGAMNFALFDRGASVDLINRDFGSLMAFAATPGALPPPRPRLAEGWLWWVHNPTGKFVLERWWDPMVPKLERGAQMAEDVIAKREVVLKAIAALQAEEGASP